MQKKKLLLLIYIPLTIAIAVIGYVSVLYWKGGTSNYEPPKQVSLPPHERARADLYELSRSVEAYFIKNMEYPQRLELLSPEFVERVPNDPLSGKSYLYSLNGSTGTTGYRISVPDPGLYSSKELCIENGIISQK
jgi:hypothetical protein